MKPPHDPSVSCGTISKEEKGTPSKKHICKEFKYYSRIERCCIDCGAWQKQDQNTKKWIEW